MLYAKWRNLCIDDDSGILEKKSECSFAGSRTYDPPIFNSDALPLNFRWLVGARTLNCRFFLSSSGNLPHGNEWKRQCCRHSLKSMGLWQPLPWNLWGHPHWYCLQHYSHGNGYCNKSLWRNPRKCHWVRLHEFCKTIQLLLNCNRLS